MVEWCWLSSSDSPEETNLSTKKRWWPDLDKQSSNKVQIIVWTCARAQPIFLSDLNLRSLHQTGGTELCGSRAAVNSRVIDQPQMSGPQSRAILKPFNRKKTHFEQFLRKKYSLTAPRAFLVCGTSLSVPPAFLPVFSGSRSPGLSAPASLLWTPSFPAGTGELASLFSWFLSGWFYVLDTRLDLNTRHPTSAGEKGTACLFPLSPLSVLCPLYSNRALGPS